MFIFFHDFTYQIGIHDHIREYSGFSEPVIDFKKTVKPESPTLRIEFVLLLIKCSFSSVFAFGQ